DRHDHALDLAQLVGQRAVLAYAQQPCYFPDRLAGLLVGDAVDDENGDAIGCAHCPISIKQWDRVAPFAALRVLSAHCMPAASRSQVVTLNNARLGQPCVQTNVVQPHETARIADPGSAWTKGDARYRVGEALRRGGKST